MLACAMACFAICYHKKMALAPFTTFAMAAMAIVLNTVAFGYVLSHRFPLFVAASSVTRYVPH